MTDTPPTVLVAPVPKLPSDSLKQWVSDWLKQPNTQKGFGAILAGITVCVFCKFQGAEAVGATLIAFGLPLIGYDNSTDVIKTQDTANAIAHAAATRTVTVQEVEALAKIARTE